MVFSLLFQDTLLKGDCLHNGSLKARNLLVKAGKRICFEGWIVVVVVFTLKNRSDLCSVPSNIRTGPTDANAFRGHRLTTQKGYI